MSRRPNRSKYWRLPSWGSHKSNRDEVQVEGPSQPATVTFTLTPPVSAVESARAALNTAFENIDTVDPSHGFEEVWSAYDNFAHVVYDEGNTYWLERLSEISRSIRESEQAAAAELSARRAFSQWFSGNLQGVNGQVEAIRQGNDMLRDFISCFVGPEPTRKQFDMFNSTPLGREEDLFAAALKASGCRSRSDFAWFLHNSRHKA